MIAHGSLSRGNNLARQCIVTVHRASGARKSPVHHPFVFSLPTREDSCFLSPAAHICAPVSVHIRPRVQPESDMIHTRRSARAALFIFQPSGWLVFQCLFARGGRRTRPRAVPSFRLLPPVPHPPQLAEGASTKHPEGPPTPPFPSGCMCVCAKFVSRHSLRRGVARVCSCALFCC